MFEPMLGWLFRAKVRSLSLHEHGLVIERGRGTSFVPWSEVESLSVGTADQVSIDTGTSRSSDSFFEIQCSGEKVQMPTRVARSCGHKFADLIVEKAKLEWFQGEAHGRPLPAMAVKPEVAANLRASFRALKK